MCVLSCMHQKVQIFYDFLATGLLLFANSLCETLLLKKIVGGEEWYANGEA